MCCIVAFCLSAPIPGITTAYIRTNTANISTLRNHCVGLEQSSLYQKSITTPKLGIFMILGWLLRLFHNNGNGEDGDSPSSLEHYDVLYTAQCYLRIVIYPKVWGGGGGGPGVEGLH